MTKRTERSPPARHGAQRAPARARCPEKRTEAESRSVRRSHPPRRRGSRAPRPLVRRRDLPLQQRAHHSAPPMGGRDADDGHARSVEVPAGHAEPERERPCSADREPVVPGGEQALRRQERRPARQRFLVGGVARRTARSARAPARTPLASHGRITRSIAAHPSRAWCASRDRSSRLGQSSLTPLAMPVKQNWDALESSAPGRPGDACHRRLR